MGRAWSSNPVGDGMEPRPSPTTDVLPETTPCYQVSSTMRPAKD